MLSDWKTNKNLPNAKYLEDFLYFKKIEIQIGYGFINLVETIKDSSNLEDVKKEARIVQLLKKTEGELLSKITQLRKEFAFYVGVILPEVHIRDNLDYSPFEYIIFIKEICKAEGSLKEDHLLAIDKTEKQENMGLLKKLEPVNNSLGKWIKKDQEEEFRFDGHTVIDHSTIIATHLENILKINLHLIFDRQDLSRILNVFKKDYPQIVDDLTPEILPNTIILRVIRNLLKENFSIKDLETILETLAEHGAHAQKRAVKLYASPSPMPYPLSSVGFGAPG